MSPETHGRQMIVVKIGGSTLGAHDTTLEDLVTLQQRGTIPVVVHGGGATITQWLQIHGISSQFVQGLRVTEEDSLKVVTAVLAGLINKELVAGLQALGGKSVGISGIDGALIEGQKQDPELGFVGQVTRVNLAPLEALREAGYIPVVSTVGFDPAAHGSSGPLTLNFNADTVAGELAHALAADKLIFLTDVPGVQDKEHNTLSHLTIGQTQALLESNVASGGMIPKLQACLRAHASGTESWIADGRIQHALLTTLSSTPNGTKVW